MVRILAIGLLLLGLAGVLIVGISRGVHPWQEKEFVEGNALSLRHSLAFLCASSLVALSIIGRPRSIWGGTLAAFAAVGFGIPLAVLSQSYDLARLDRLEWAKETFLTFTPFICGGIVALAVDYRSRPSVPRRDETSQEEGKG